MGEVRTVSATGGEKGVKEEQFDQIPIDALFEFARHYGKGAEKYDAHNFRRGYEWSKSFNAMMRHAFAWWGGEMDDPETGTSHMAAVAWHAFNLMQLAIDHPEFDDRYKKQQPLDALESAFAEALAEQPKRYEGAAGGSNLLSDFAEAVANASPDTPLLAFLSREDAKRFSEQPQRAKAAAYEHARDVDLGDEFYWCTLAGCCVSSETFIDAHDIRVTRLA